MSLQPAFQIRVRHVAVLSGLFADPVAAPPPDPVAVSRTDPVAAPPPDPVAVAPARPAPRPGSAATSSSRSLSWRSPLCVWLLTVPTEMPSRSAVSASDKPSRYRSTTHSRLRIGSVATARRNSATAAASGAGARRLQVSGPQHPPLDHPAPDGLARQVDDGALQIHRRGLRIGDPPPPTPEPQVGLLRKLLSQVPVTHERERGIDDPRIVSVEQRLDRLVGIALRAALRAAERDDVVWHVSKDAPPAPKVAAERPNNRPASPSRVAGLPPPGPG